MRRVYAVHVLYRCSEDSEDNQSNGEPVKDFVDHTPPGHRQAVAFSFPGYAGGYSLGLGWGKVVCAEMQRILKEAGLTGLSSSGSGRIRSGKKEWGGKRGRPRPVDGAGRPVTVVLCCKL